MSLGALSEDNVQGAWAEMFFFLGKCVGEKGPKLDKQGGIVICIFGR